MRWMYKPVNDLPVAQLDGAPRDQEIVYGCVAVLTQSNPTTSVETATRPLFLESLEPSTEPSSPPPLDSACPEQANGAPTPVDIAELKRKSVAELHAGPSAYSNLISLSANEAGCLYERGEKRAYEKITFARFEVAR